MHRRTGRPQANPIVTRLSHEDTRKFKALCAKKGTSVHFLLGNLARAELKTFEDVNAREIDDSPEIYEMGFVPKRENPEENPRPRDVDALTRDTRPRTLDRPGWR